MTRCIIICAGDGSRWNDYLGAPKHLLRVNGERLIDRTVRLIHQHDPTAEVFVVVKQKSPDYEVAGASQYVARLDPSNGGADKFLSSRELWNNSGRTIVFYGDVWFSQAAMKTIFSFEPKEWILFCLPGASEASGTSGECFAQSFYPEHIPEHEANLRLIVNAERNGRLKGGGWQHYRAMADVPLDEHRMNGRYVEIKDFTSDFDSAEEYERWMAAYVSYLS